MARIFKVGDRVQVREFNEMAEENKLERLDGISFIRFLHGFSFMDEMRKYCGEVGTIVNVYPRQGYQSIAVEFDNGSLDKGGWCFTNHMFNHIDEKTVELPDVTDLYC